MSVNVEKYCCSRIVSRHNKSNQIEFICDTKQNINECDIIIRQMCRQDTKAVPTALTGALEVKTQITTANEDSTN